MIDSNFKPGKDREEKIDKFLDNLAWFHNEKTTPIGLYGKIGKIEERIDTLNGGIDKLNNNFEKADKSSTNLTKALNRITLAGAIIAGLGVLIAILNFIFQYNIFK